jgi:hydrogenase maturation protein HypF
MLPCTPLHHILIRELNIPVVATSGNISDEPICTDEHEAVKQLKGIADMFLVHNRPIRRHMDDSIARIILGREQILRRARGYAPLPIAINNWNKSSSLIAVGAHVKNTIALSVGENIMLSQHIGDLGTAEAFHAFTNAVDDFKQLYKVNPENILCDAHPEYLSGKYARSMATNVEEVQHHYAHVASCMAENRLDGRVLGVSWDGTGFGTDGTIWGGEFFLTTETSFERVATFAPFPLPGGEQAIREPRRAALGLLYEIFGESLFEKKELFPLLQFSGKERIILRAMLAHRINTPLTTSVGRLFDAVASIINLRHYVSFEGQAAMEMEFLAGVTLENNRYRSEIVDNHSLPHIDLRPMVLEILNDVQTGVCRQIISTKFHNTISGSILEIAKRFGEKRIVLSGGCFQNRYLTERTVMLLRHEGFQPYWHQRVPTNDGGIALGQIYASIRKNKIDNAVDQVFHHEESEEISDVSWNSR